MKGKLMPFRTLHVMEYTMAFQIKLLINSERSRYYVNLRDNIRYNVKYNVNVNIVIIIIPSEPTC